MTARFMGMSELLLDDKWRVIIPSKFREAIPDSETESGAGGFVATPGPEECLFLYTTGEWERICQLQARLPKGSPGFRQFQRLWYASAEFLTLDRQGRILLPERLRSLVNIDREIVVAGCYDRLEVWPKPAWFAAQAAARSSYAHQMQAFLGGEEPVE